MNSDKGNQLNKRAAWCDYHAARFYLITISCTPDAPPLSHISGESAPVARAVASEIGLAIAPELKRISEIYPQLSVDFSVIMPDHLHLLVSVKERLPIHLGQIIALMKLNMEKVYRLLFAPCESSSRQARLFNEGFNDRPVYRRGQLAAFRKYIADNPRRYWIKKNKREFFRRVNRLVINGREYAAFGNFLLLRDPNCSWLHISRRFSSEQKRRLEAEWSETIRAGGVLISPFISCEERQWRDRAIAEGAKVVRLSAEGFGERFKPSGREFELCAEGRLLIIGAAEFSSRKHELTREECLHLNRLAEELAAGARLSVSALTDTPGS